MTYAKIDNGSVVTYPYSVRELKQDNPEVSFPNPIDEQTLADFGVVTVVAAEKPTVNELLYDVTEGTPVLNGSDWTQAWDVVELTTQDKAERLASRKAELKAQTNEERDRREEAGFTYLGKVFDSDSRSVQRIGVVVAAAQAALAAEQPFSITWTVADNTTVTMDAMEVLGMNTALAIYGDALHQHARVLKDQIDVATAETISSIDITTGW